ncbi:YadA C-terminal domain-containing protein [Acinetobacter sp.]|uniref:YadA C-terminal domain-containing protein n=1 Tax=Acinetobacter sp. TaxID=472 RepID=UPI00388E5F2A
MKFQKTLLAVALAFSAVAVNAAPQPVEGKTPVYQYGKSTDYSATDVIYKINGIAYSLEDTGFVKFEGDASKYTNLLRGGLVDSVELLGQEYEETYTGSWSDETIFAEKWSDTVVFGEESNTSLGGTITGPAAGTEQGIDADIYVPGYAYLKETVQQDFVAGDISENSVGVRVSDLTATYDKDNKVLSSVTSGTALTSKGLGLVGNANTANPNVKVDFEKGLVTETVNFGGIATPNQEVKAYGKDNTVEVIEVAGNFYSVAENGTDLTAYKGDTTKLALIGAGAANGLNDSKTESKTTQAFVGADKVTYGESTLSYDNANTLTVGNADVGSVLEAGKQYNLGGAENKPVETAQSVTTGIVKTDEDGKNTYGVLVSQKETGKADKFTEVNAEGITTTGVINAADFQIGGVSIVQNIQTSVGEATQEVVAQVETQLAANQTFVTEAVAAVDAGLTAAATDRQAIRVAAVEGDAATLASANAYTDNAVSGFNSRVGQLNSRIDDVEKTSYRGIAIALAAQQQIPNIGAGQFAVFGGVGHYEGESAAALGVASVFADGRTSVSAALGFAGGSEVGGRVGVSYVFGGK